MIKKCFTVWKEPYGYFLLFCFVFCGCISFIEFKRGHLEQTGDFIGLLILLLVTVSLYHFIFIVTMQGLENDKRRVLESHTLSLAEFSKEYDLPEESALQLLKEGKLEGIIAFKTYSLREKTKEEVQHLTNQEPN